MKNCSQLLKSIFFSLTISLMYAQHFNVEISPTGESTLFIFEDTVDILGTGVNSGDEFGLFDTNGIVDEDTPINAETIRKIEMPNANGFIDRSHIQ